MIGRKNIVFGFLYLVLTAALGPYMITQLFPAVQQAQVQKQKVMGDLQLSASAGFENQNTLAPMTGAEIGKADAHALLALNKVLNAQAPIDAIKGGPHTHGNLESVLNIVVGLVLCFIAAAPLVKQAVSWIFILGALLHSGMLYLQAFDVSWAGAVLNTGVGPGLILVGLLVAGVVAGFGFRGELVRDRQW
ncbi:MAG TPA: hypothetical protein VKA14_07430 [Gammaproteobacteria bacterium]|nr:hypothetical protein [Gammaproteobacteria bacterium]